MEVTQTNAAPAAPTPSEAPAEAPAQTANIQDNYDATGKQVVEDDVFSFDDETTEQPVEIQPTETEQPEEAKTEEKPTEEPKKEEPQTELKLYANKFNNVQDLKNAFIQLGGDPEDYAENVGDLEHAYQIRQREYSKAHADLATQQEDTPPTVQDLMSEEFKEVDPNTFEGPADMWKAMMEGMANVMTKVQENQKPTPQITPEQITYQVETTKQLSNLEGQVPRLKTDKNFRDLFATHINMLKAENRMPTVDGGRIPDIKEAFKDFIEGFSSSVTEAQKIFDKQKEDKDLTTAVNNDNANANPASQPQASPDDALLDGLLDYTKQYQKMYS